MADTFSQIYLQFVFAVQNRKKLIPPDQKEELHAYLGGLVNNRGSKLLAVHCMPDHCHLFVGFKPTISIPDFVKEIKVESNEFINSKCWTPCRFKWQEGYGVFSYSQSHIDRVCKYIINQEEHHKKQSFKKEYLKLLKHFNVEYNEKYLFDFDI